MPRTSCPVCSSGRAPDINRMKETGVPKDAIAKQTEFSRTAIRAHFRNCDTPPFDPSVQSASASTISIEDHDKPLSNDAEILGVLGIDPESYRIVGGTNVSARTLASGQQLYSYRAKIQPIDVVDESEFNIERWRSKLEQAREREPQASFNGMTYAIFPGDQQLGKKNFEETLENWRDGIIAHVDECKHLINSGMDISQVFIGFGGDICEGIAGNYENQLFTVRLNLSSQIELAYDMVCWTVQYVIEELNLPLVVSTVISNHGEWTRMGAKKPQTTGGDNIDTHIARLVEKTFAKVKGFENITWHISEGEPANLIDLSGVRVYHTHGHVQKGSGQGLINRFASAMQKQVLGNIRELGEVRLWVGHHYHHLEMYQDRESTYFLCPALEAEKSSEWLLEMSGVWSKPGILGMVISEDYPMGWNRSNVF